MSSFASSAPPSPAAGGSTAGDARRGVRRGGPVAARLGHHDRRSDCPAADRNRSVQDRERPLRVSRGAGASDFRSGQFCPHGSRDRRTWLAVAARRLALHGTGGVRDSSRARGPVGRRPHAGIQLLHRVRGHGAICRGARVRHPGRRTGSGTWPREPRVAAARNVERHVASPRSRSRAGARWRHGVASRQLGEVDHRDSRCRNRADACRQLAKDLRVPRLVGAAGLGARDRGHRAAFAGKPARRAANPARTDTHSPLGRTARRPRARRFAGRPGTPRSRGTRGMHGRNARLPRSVARSAPARLARAHRGARVRAKCRRRGRFGVRLPAAPHRRCEADRAAPRAGLPGYG